MAEVREQLVIEALVRDAVTAELRRIGTGVDTFSKKTDRGFDRARRSVSRFNRTIGLVRGAVRRLRPGLSSLLATLSGFAAVGVATRSAGAFQLKLAEIGTLIPGTRDDLESFGDEILALSKSFGVNEIEAATAAYQALSAGIEPGVDTMRLLEQSSKLAIGGVASVADSTNLLVSAIKSYKLEASDASRVADIFFRGVKEGRVTISDIASSFGTAAPLASELGVSIEELTAALASITATGGGNTSEAATQIAAVLRALLRQASDVDDLFRTKLGKSFDDTTIRTRGLADVLEDLREATGGSASALISLLGRAEAANAVLNLTGRNAENFRRTIDATTDSLGAADEAFSEVFDADVSRGRRLLNALRVEALKLGDAVIAAAGNLIDSVGGVENITQAFRLGIDSLSALVEILFVKFGGVIERVNLFVDRLGGIDRAGSLIGAGVKVLVEGFTLGFATIGDAFISLIESIAKLTAAIIDLGAKLNVRSFIGYAVGAGDASDQVEKLRTTLLSLESAATAAADAGDFEEYARLGVLIADARMQLERMESAAGALDAATPETFLGRLELRIEALTKSAEEFWRLWRTGATATTPGLTDDQFRAVSEGIATSQLASTLTAMRTTFVAAATGIGAAFGVSFSKAARDTIESEASQREFFEFIKVDSGSPVIQFLDLAKTKVFELQKALLATAQQQLVLNVTARSSVEQYIDALDRQIVSQVLNRENIGKTTSELAKMVREIERLALSGGRAFRQGFIRSLEDVREFIENDFAAGVEFARDSVFAFSDTLGDAFTSIVTDAKSGKDAMRDFARSFATDITRMISRLLALDAASGILGALGISIGATAVATETPGAFGAFAKGSPKIPGGLGPVIPYASAGPIVRRPHVALIGEGQFDEAVVPLPDGRSIPVRMQGGRRAGEDQRGATMQANVTLNITGLDPRGTADLLTQPSVWSKIERQLADSLTQGSSQALKVAIRGV